MAACRWAWGPSARAFSTTKTTVPLAHQADQPVSLPSSHYTVTPPVQPWPHRLTERSLLPLLLRLPTPHLAVLTFRHAFFHATPPLPPSLLVFAAVLSRLPTADPALLPPGLVGIADLDAALKFLDEMPGLGIDLDVVTYTTVLSAYCGKVDLEGAQKLFDDIMVSGRRPDVTTYTVLIDGYCQCRKLQDVARIMDEMEAAKVQPNEVSYSLVIEACCKQGKSAEALDLM
ncbi:hypothetical protein ABZP36_023917 [Zizania latifolia]